MNNDSKIVDDTGHLLAGFLGTAVHGYPILRPTMNLSRVSRTLLAESAAPTQKATPPSPAMNGDVFVQRPKPIRAIQWSLGLPVDF